MRPLFAERVEPTAQVRTPCLVQWDDLIGSPGRTRTCDMLINSQPLYQLSYRGILKSSGKLKV